MTIYTTIAPAITTRAHASTQNNTTDRSGKHLSRRMRMALHTTALIPLTLFANPAWVNCSTNGLTTTCTQDPFPYSSSVDGGESSSRSFVFQYLNKNPSNNGTASVIDIESVGDHGSDSGDDGKQGRPIDIYYDADDYTMSSSQGSFRVYSTGGSGHDGKDRTGDAGISGGSGGHGGAGGGMYFDWAQGTINAAGAMEFSSTGGAGGDGGKGKADLGNATGDDGGDGGAGGILSLVLGTQNALSYNGGANSRLVSWR